MELEHLGDLYRDLDGPLGSAAAAAVLVPLLLDAVRPASVLDVGCGVGSFMRAFQRAGVHDVLGVDAPAFADSLLVVEPNLVQRCDVSKPLDLGRRFDLALCLEVGGYFPEHDVLVASLVRHAPVIAFSAAIPDQDMINQRYGAYPSHWAPLFAKHGYEAVDALRGLIWTDERLPFWFRQNLLLFAEQATAERLRLAAGPAPLDIVHPKLYEMLAGTGESGSFKLGLVRLGRVAAAKLRRRLTRR
ncbi:MAG: class I SAM-dependent methyltransferase [Rubrivivax sp.]|nr:class I SAM-dependent methyltransferase [Rubrivivax sp.]